MHINWASGVKTYGSAEKATSNLQGRGLGEDVLGKPTDTCKDYKNFNGREITQDEYLRMSLSIKGQENGITF